MREAGTEEQSGVSHLHWNVDLSSSQDLLRTHLLTASLCLQVVATSPPCYQCLDRSLKIIIKYFYSGADSHFLFWKLLLVDLKPVSEAEQINMPIVATRFFF